MYLLLSMTLSLISFYQFRSNYLVGISMLIVFLGILYFAEQKEIKQLLKKQVEH